MTGGGWAVVVVWVWWGRVGFPNTAEFNMAVFMVGTWCMCCVHKAKVFRKQNYRRFEEGQFTKVGCKTNMLKQCIIAG